MPSRKVSRITAAKKTPLAQMKAYLRRAHVGPKVRAQLEAVIARNDRTEIELQYTAMSRAEQSIRRTEKALGGGFGQRSMLAASQMLDLMAAHTPEDLILASQLEAALSSTRTDGEACDKLIDWIMQLSNHAGIQVYHPQLVFTVFLMSVEQMKKGFKGEHADVEESCTRQAYEAIQEILSGLKKRGRKAS